MALLHFEPLSPRTTKGDLLRFVCEQAGDCLVDLVVQEERGGLGGRFLLTLVKRDRSQALPWTRLQAGTPVLLAPQQGKGDTGWRGVVCERGERAITVAFNDPIEDD